MCKDDGDVDEDDEDDDGDDDDGEQRWHLLYGRPSLSSLSSVPSTSSIVLFALKPKR